MVKVTRNIDVNVPAGVDNDTRLRVRGEGEGGNAGAGDLYLYILVQKHSLFERHGKDLNCEILISFVRAALGSEVLVPTLSGNVSMKIPTGTQSGKVFRLKAKGMPDLHGGPQGDQYAKVMIQVPERLSGEQRRLLEEFAKVSGEDISKSDSLADKFKNAFK